MNTATSNDLNVDALMAQAVRETGLDDFGTTASEEGLRNLVASANRDVAWTPMGRMAFEMDLHRLLVNRLRTLDALKRHPEILDEDVSDPVIVLGLMRTGTTKLQRMLAADAGVQRTDFWRLYNPAPFPHAVPGAEDPRIAAARQVTSALRQMAPDFMAGHPTDADEVDEEPFLQEATFRTTVHFMRAPVYRYYDWVRSQSLDDTYVYLKNSLQYLQWQDGGKRGRPWILKSPVHLGHLDALLEMFPKATLVHCHRDVAECIPSFCRLVESVWSMSTTAYDPHRLGQAIFGMMADAMRRYLDARQRLEAKTNILDVRFDAVVNDPMRVVRDIYRRGGRELTPDNEQRIRDWCERNPAHRYGKHEYTLARFGLTETAVAEAFAGYRSRFADLLR